MRHRGKQRIVTHKVIFGPEGNPRKDEKEYAHLKTEHDIDDGEEAIHQFSRSGSQAAGKVMGLPPAVTDGLTLKLSAEVRESFPPRLGSRYSGYKPR